MNNASMNTQVFTGANVPVKIAAKVMKKNKKQIDNLLYRAKNALRAVIGKEGEQLI